MKLAKCLVLSASLAALPAIAQTTLSGPSAAGSPPASVDPVYASNTPPVSSVGRDGTVGGSPATVARSSNRPAPMAMDTERRAPGYWSPGQMMDRAGKRIRNTGRTVASIPDHMRGYPYEEPVAYP